MVAEYDVNSSLTVLLVFSAILLSMAATASLMGWSRWRDLRQAERSIPAKEFQPEVIEPRRDGSQLRLIPADASVELGPVADQVLKDVLDLTTRVRFAYLFAALAYAALSTAFLLRATAVGQKIPVLIMSYLILAPQLVIVTWFSRMSLRQRLLTFLGYSLIGSLLGLLLLSARSKEMLWLVKLLIYPPDGPLTILETPIGLFVVFPLVGLYLLRSRRMRPFLAFLAASLLYAGPGWIAFRLITSDSAQLVLAAASTQPWLIPVSLANVVLGVILAGKLLRLIPRSRLHFGLAILAVVGVGIVGYGMPLHGAPLVLVIFSSTACSVLGMLFTWAIFKSFVWLQELGRWLTPAILAAHFCWTYLTLCLVLYAWEFRGSLLSGSDLSLLVLSLGCVVALALHLAVLHMLLRRIRSRRPRWVPKRLLLLRVFGRTGELENLLDALDDIWRPLGPVDLLATSTFSSSVLEAFLLRRGADRFLKTDEEVNQRLLDPRPELEGDARYLVNGVYCSGNVWRRAFVRLAQDATIVLMDLRGFTSEHTGCAWELAYLVKHLPLRRILLLVDDDPKQRALIEQEAQEAWTYLPLDSPNTSDQEPELNDLTYHRRSAVDRQKLFRLLLRAAGDSAAT